MYIPAHFRETDLARLDEHAAHDAFGTLVSTLAGAPFATHMPMMPMLYARENAAVKLTGHWARQNSQWQEIEQQPRAVHLPWPHAYSSPRWYAEPLRNVPTWNYATTHICGRIVLIHDAQRLERIVDSLARKYEAGAAEPSRPCCRLSSNCVLLCVSVAKSSPRA